MKRMLKTPRTNIERTKKKFKKKEKIYVVYFRSGTILSKKKT